MVDTTRLEDVGMNDAGGPTGVRHTPLWALLVLALVAALVGGAGGYVWGESDASRASTDPGQWAYLGGPPTRAGGAYVYTRCAGPTRLLLTVGADGFPVGPVGQILFEQGSGCPR